MAMLLSSTVRAGITWQVGVQQQDHRLWQKREHTTQTTGSLARFLAAAALTGHRHCLHWQQRPQSCGAHVHGGGQSQLPQHVLQT